MAKNKDRHPVSARRSERYEMRLKLRRMRDAMRKDTLRKGQCVRKFDKRRRLEKTIGIKIDPVGFNAFRQN